MTSLVPSPSAFLLFLILSASACGAGWHRIDPAVPSTFPKRQQVQLWRGGQPLQLHAVEFSGDSVSGVRYVQSPDCDSCRVAVARASVDSLRTGSPTAGFWKTTGLVIGGLAVVTVIACATEENACVAD
jgi:hypothetical protein